MSENGRRADGKFAPGYKGGPGNPHIAQVRACRDRLLGVWTPDEMEKIARDMLKTATETDPEKVSPGVKLATQLAIIERLHGKALQAIVVADGFEVDPFEDLRAERERILSDPEFKRRVIEVGYAEAEAETHEPAEA